MNFRDPHAEALWSGTATGLLIFFVGGWLFWNALNTMGLLLVDAGSWWHFLRELWHFKQTGGALLQMHPNFLARVFVPLTMAIALSALVARAAYLGEKKAADGRHIRGRKYLKDQEALREFARISKLECRQSPAGIRLHSSLPPISTKRECRHFLIVGSVGAGKTQVLTPTIVAAIQRGDRSFVVDVKGDFTSLLPDPVAILAPWDARSMVWNISADVSDKASARAFAAGVIEESSGSPMWSNSARQVLIGCIVKLQHERPSAWGFRDLSELVFCGDLDFFQQTMQQYFPEGFAAVSGSSATTAGILINMTSYLSIIADLAEAWPEPPRKDSGFSIRRWLADDSTRDRTVILAANGRFQLLQIGLARALLNIASQTIADPIQVGESSTRKIWFFLDEFPQLRDVSAVGALLETGRSKGVRVVFGVQDIAQLRAIYGPERAKAWASMIANHVIAQTMPGETADFVARQIIGDREVERLSVSRTFGEGVGGEAGIFTPGGTATTSTLIETRPVLLPSQLTTELGPCENGVRVLWLGYGDALRLTIPYTSLPPQRPAVVLADWASESVAKDRECGYEIPAYATNPTSSTDKPIPELPLPMIFSTRPSDDTNDFSEGD